MGSIFALLYTFQFCAASFHEERVTQSGKKMATAPAVDIGTADVLIAYDGSGSTSNAALYHAMAAEIALSHPTANILFWDTKCRILCRRELAEINQARKGFGGTQPQCVSAFIKEADFHGHLVLITDGQISAGDIDQSELPGGWTFTKVDCYLIGTGGEVNMSVTCPFTRQSPHVVRLYKDNVADKMTTYSVSVEDLAAVTFIDNIETVADYLNAADALDKAIIARTMGALGEPTLLDKVLQMKKRITANEAKALGESDTAAALEAALLSGRVMDALNIAGRLTAEYYAGEDGEDDRTWSGRISRLVSMCQGALRRGAFDLQAVNQAIRSDRIRRADVVAAAPSNAVVPAADATLESAAVFVCPISLDGAHDVIILVGDDVPPILSGLDTAVVNDLMDCPLNALNYPDVVERIKAALDHPIGLSSYIEANAVGHPIEASPMTRRPVSGGLCLGSSRSHCDATRFTLCKLVSGGKVAGSADLWFAVVWLLVQRGEIPYLAPVLPALTEHLQYRLANHKTALALTGLPELPTTRVPVRVAVWYVLAASALELPPKREPLRAHLLHFDALRDLVILTGFPIPDGVEEHHLRLRVFFQMMGCAKRSQCEFESLIYALKFPTVALDKKSIRDEVMQRAQYPITLIPVDGAALSDDDANAVVQKYFPPLWRKLPVPVLATLAGMVDVTVANGSVAIPFRFAPALERCGVQNWKYSKDVPRIKVVISQGTCRPFFNLAKPENPGEEAVQTWRTEAKLVYGMEPEELLARHENYGKFVDTFHFYPTRDELILFSYCRCRGSTVAYRFRSTMPVCITQLAEDTVADFADIAAKMSVEEFSDRRTQSREIKWRITFE